MTKLSILIRFSCLLGAYAAVSSISDDKVTLTILADTDGQGVGFLVKIDGCPDGGCEKNSSALFKIQDDDGNSKHDGTCGDFDDFRDNSDEGTSKNEDFFFIAFQMTTGNQGQYFMSKGCFQEAGAGVEADDGKIWPGESEWKSLEWTAPNRQFGSQPDFTPNKARSANKTDVYIPELLLVTPHSKDAALEYNNAGYRTSQYRYVESKEKLVLYFSEKVTGQEGKNVYVYEFAPGTLWDATTAAATGQALAAKDFASDEKFFGTKHTGTPTLKENRLYKVLIDAGAFEDTKGNAARGVNGQAAESWTTGNAVGKPSAASSYSLCVFDADRNAAADEARHTTCGIVFVVGLTLTAGDNVDVFPEAVAAVDNTNGYIDISANTEITQETNVWIDFKQVVEPGDVNTEMKVNFGADPLDGADLTINKGGTGDSCFDDNRCHALFSSTFYLFEPNTELTDNGETSNSTEVTVSFSRGTFDYVNAFTHTFITNRTEYDGHAPQILAHSFIEAGVETAVYRGTDAYYETEADLKSGPDSLVLYFDTRVEGVTGKFVTFTPLDYSGEEPFSIAANKECYDASEPSNEDTAGLAPCRLAADESTTLVTFEDGESESKVIITPGALIPGQTYEITIDEGAFVGQAEKGTPKASAAWSTRIRQAQTVTSCTVGDNGGASKMHRSSAIKVTFGGPVHVAADKAITIGPYDSTDAENSFFTETYPQSLSDADVVYMRNKADAADDFFMMIIEPRTADGTEVGMPANKAIQVHVEAGVIQNFDVTGDSQILHAGCSYSTLYEDLVPPQLLSVSGLKADGVSQDKYSFSDFGDNEFKLEFSEKVVGAGTATFVGSTWSKTFDLAGGADDTGVTSEVSGREVTLTVEGDLEAGDYTLTVPLASLTDTATETGVLGNAFEVSASCAAPCLAVAAGATSATYKVVVEDKGNTAPACTVANTGMQQGSSGDQDVVASNTAMSRTLVLQFAEEVKIRTGSSKIEMMGKKCDDGACDDVDVLSVTLGTGIGDGVLTCETGNGCTDGVTGASLEFDWMDGCEGTTKGCQQATNAAGPGGGHYLFLFLTDFVVMEAFESYYFKFQSDSSLTTAYDYPVSLACNDAYSEKLGEFSVYDPVGAGDATPTVTLTDGTNPIGSTDNLLLTFDEKVKYVNVDDIKVTFTFGTDYPTPAGASTTSAFGNVTHGVVLSATGTEAVVHVPYKGDYPGNPSAFTFLTVAISNNAFIDLAIAGGNQTVSVSETYNSTDANAMWDPNATSTMTLADEVKPKVLMMLPGGATDNKQRLTGINTSALIYLVMSENVSETGEGGVELWNCGEYILARRDDGATGVSGFSNVPLVNVDCGSLDAEQETMADVTLLDNTYGSSVVQLQPRSGPLKYSSKYYVQIKAGTFKDRSGNENEEQPTAGTRHKFEFFTEGSRTKPAVERYVYAYDSASSPVTEVAAGSTVMEVWFDMPVQKFSDTNLLKGLDDAGADNDIATTVTCNGGFKCSITANAGMSDDTVYLVKIPDTIMDREENKLVFDDQDAAVSFRTQLRDLTAPEVLFCTSVAATATSLEFKVGFTEAIKLYGGYSQYEVAGALRAGDATSLDKKAELQLEAGGLVLHVSSSSAEELVQDTNYTLVIAAAEIEDLAGNTLAGDLKVSTNADEVDSIGANCFVELVTLIKDVTPPEKADGTPTLPADGATDVHNGDYVVFFFNEEMKGVADAAVTLTHCGPESTVSSCTGVSGSNPANSGAAVESISASELEFGGNKNAVWQFATELDQGSVYKVSAPSSSFTDLTGNELAGAIDITFQVALEATDYRGTSITDGAISKGQAYNLNSVAYFKGADGIVSRLMEDSLDTTQDQTLSLFFAQKVKGGASVKLYFNETNGDHYYQGVAAVGSAGTFLTHKISKDSLGAGKTYALHVYANDADWSTDIFEDADTYYTHFGNYKGVKTYSASYQQPAAAHFDFETAATAAPVYYSTPTVSASPFKAEGGVALNKTTDLATSSMLEIDVSTNGTMIKVGADAVTVHKAARLMASTTGQEACDDLSFEKCCSTEWSEEDKTQSHYVDYSGAVNRARNSPVENYVAKVYFALDGGFDATHCYRVAVKANGFDDGEADGTAPSADRPDYISWFITDDTDHDTDITGPVVAAEEPFKVSSQGADGNFGLVARTAFLTVTFAEAVTPVNLAGVTLTPGTLNTPTQSLDGTQLTITVADSHNSGVLAACVEHTLTVAAGAVSDAAGNYMSSDFTQKFTTVCEDGDTPTALHEIPESGDTASVDARAVYFMSERVFAKTGVDAEVGGGSSGSVDVAQSTWHSFEHGIDANTLGAVMVEDTRVTFGWHLGLAQGDDQTMTINAGGLTDRSGKVNAADLEVEFTAADFGAFADATQTDGANSANPYGGNAMAEVEGATAVTCGKTLFLVGGAKDTVSKWDGSAWTEGNGDGLGDRKFASVAVSQDVNATCTLWVVGGSGAAVTLVRSVGEGKFEEANPRPLPVTERQEDGSSLVREGKRMGEDELEGFEGTTVAVANGWQTVVCGGGLSTCWVCKDAHCAVAGRSKPVPDAVRDRYYGSVLVVGGGSVYHFGGLNAKEGSETRCHQSVYKWDVVRDVWTGMTAQLDLDSDKPQRCWSAYAQAGDGMIVVLGGKNATDKIKGTYSVGPLLTGMKATRPYRDSTAHEAGSTYADGYAAPVLVATGPTGGAVLAAAAPVHLVFSEPVEPGAKCVTVKVTDADDALTTMECSAQDGVCYTGACGTMAATKVDGSEVSIARSILAIKLGTVGAGSSIEVEFDDDIVRDANGNAFAKAQGKRSADGSSLGEPASFTFTIAAAPVDFAGSWVHPTDGATGVELDTNLVFDFNRKLSESDSILSDFKLTLEPVRGNDFNDADGNKYFTISFNENSTDHFAFVGDILKVKLSEELIPGMEYKATLAKDSVTGADKDGDNAKLEVSFTARDGPPRGEGPAGVEFVVPGGELDADLSEQNDTVGDTPSVASVWPPPQMTGVRTDKVHVVYTFSEAVRLQDAANKSNGQISEAFKLMFWNTTNPDSDHHEYDLEKDVTDQAFVNTTGRTITFALEGLKKGTRYTIEFDSAVVMDFGETTHTAAWNSIDNEIEDYYFTTVGTVTDAAKPKVVGHYLTPVTAAGEIILGDEDDTTVMVVFDRPLDTDEVITADCVVNPPDTPWCELGDSTSLADVLTVTIPDEGEKGFSVGTSTWDLLLEGAEPGAHAVNMTARLPTLVSLSNSFPLDDGEDYKKYSSDSTVVLEFSEDIQAHTGTLEKPALVTLEAQNDAHNSLEFDFGMVDADGKPYVTVVGKYLVIEPRGTESLMPGEQFRVSMNNGTVKGVTTAVNGRPAQQKPTWNAEDQQFATVAKILFSGIGTDAGTENSIALNLVQSGAAVAFGPDNALYVIGGKRLEGASFSGDVSNKTSRSLTYRDTDAGAGAAKPEPCFDPCNVKDQDVQKTVFSDASVRGLRHKATSGVAFSVRGSVLANTKLEGACVCPTCIEAPSEAEIPEWGNFFRDEATEYTQVNAADSVQLLTCDVGVDVLKPNQGYDATDSFVCTIGEVTYEDDLAQYFGIWKIDSDACVPKNCGEMPIYPEASIKDTGTCEAFEAGDGNTSSFSLPHGANCTVKCSPGYERTGLYECDRGIYSNEVQCTKRKCSHGAVQNGELNGGRGAAEVSYGDSFKLTCDAGYEANRAEAECVEMSGDAESDVTAGEPLQCTVQSCEGKPEVTNGAVECDSNPIFKSECKVTCEEGYRYGSAEPQSQTGTVVCEATGASVQWSAAEKCVPVTCAVPSLPSADFKQATTAVTDPVNYGEKLPLTCEIGYGTDAADPDSDTYSADCTVNDKYESTYDTGQNECVPLDCPALDTISGGFALTLEAGYSATEAFKAGERSTFACAKGKPVDTNYKYVKCIEGKINMCATQDCLSPKKMESTDKACMAEDQETVTENRVESKLTMEVDLGAAGRRLSSAATLEEKKSELTLSFRKGMADQLSVPLANIQVTETKFKAIPGGSKVQVEISFYVVVPAGQSVDKFQSSLGDIADGTTTLDKFQKVFQEEMAAAGVNLTVDVDSIKVEEPTLTAVQVAKPAEEDGGGADAEEGGGGVVVIVVVVLVVLAVVAGVVYKFVLKK